MGAASLAGGEPRAHAASNESIAASAIGPAHAELPPHIHRKRNGRYVRDMCDTTQRFHCLAKELLPESWHPGDPLDGRLGTPRPEGTPTGPTGTETLAAAYGIPSTAAANGKIVAVIDAPDNHALSDLTTYRSQQGLPAMARCDGMPTGTGTACFAQVAEDGTASTGTDPSPGADGETSLDTQMVSVACPDCSILLVEVNFNFCETDIVAGVATATTLGASAISISLGGPEVTDPNGLTVDAGAVGTEPDAAVAGCPAEANWEYDLPGPFSSPGHLVFVAAGDFAYDNENAGFSASVGGASPSYPSSSPYVIAVGGTALYQNGTTYGEGVWDDGNFGLFEDSNPTSTGIYQDVTTSGCSTEFAMPPWQETVLAGTACKMRATSDVAAAATFFTGGMEAGISIIVAGGYEVAEGTSASSPIVAGFFTRLGLTTEASNDLSWVYAHRTAFNDVGSTTYPIPAGASSTDAPAGVSCGVLCTAETGWDGPTGVGSVNGAALAALPVSTAAPVAYPDAGVCGPYGTCTLTFEAGTTSARGGCNCTAAGAAPEAGWSWIGGLGAGAILLARGARGRARARRRSDEG